jgi:DNA-binding NarL/FixJ family response regulator
LAEEIALQPDMEIVGEPLDPLEVLLTAKIREADVVVIPFSDPNDPGLLSHLFAELPNVTVLMTSSSGYPSYVVQLCPHRRELLDTSELNLVRVLRNVVRNPCSPIDDLAG